MKGEEKRREERREERRKKGSPADKPRPHVASISDAPRERRPREAPFDAVLTRRGLRARRPWQKPRKGLFNTIAGPSIGHRGHGRFAMGFLRCPSHTITQSHSLSRSLSRSHAVATASRIAAALPPSLSQTHQSQ